MAKQPAEKIKRAKTPAELAKKEKNEQLAAERLVKLQEQQKKLHQLRKQGYGGSDWHIIQQLKQEENIARKKKLEEEQQRLIKEKEMLERQFVEEALNGPSGAVLKRWLVGPATYKKVVQFFKSHNLPRVAPKEPVKLENLPKLEIPIP
jgi:hypothetical protein